VRCPTFFIMMGFVVAIALFPGIVLWFPNLILGR
jgi:hypothetical protein